MFGVYFGLAVTDFIFLGSNVTADGDCSHEIKKQLLLGRKAITNLDSILKNRDITLLIKVCTVKAMVFPVVMYGCESWTVKKDFQGKLWAFYRILLDSVTSSRKLVRKSCLTL